MNSRFDWYQATFESLDDGRAAPNIALSLGGRVVFAKPLYGYTRAWAIERNNEVLATVFEGSNRAGEIHIQTTSDSCDEVVPLIRSLWPSHRVSRADAAIDFEADYDRIHDAALAFAKERNLAWSEIKNSEGGATFRVGSPSSERYVKVYKKSEELRAKHPERADEIPDGIVRAELVIRPSKHQAKEKLASMSPTDTWGLGKWTQDFAQTLLGFDSERVQIRFKKPSDWSRSLHYLGLQYSPMISKRLETHDYDDVLDEVLSVLGLRV